MILVHFVLMDEYNHNVRNSIFQLTVHSLQVSLSDRYNAAHISNILDPNNAQAERTDHYDGVDSAGVLLGGSRRRSPTPFGGPRLHLSLLCSSIASLIF